MCCSSAIEAGRFDKAAAHLQGAGLQAASRSGHREALAFYEQALAALKRLPRDAPRMGRELELRLLMFQSLVPAGAFERLGPFLSETAALAESSASPTWLARVCCARAVVAWMMAQYAPAIDCARRALAFAGETDDVGLVVEGTLQLGAGYTCVGRYRDGAGALRGNVDRLVGERALLRRGPSFPYVAART